MEEPDLTWVLDELIGWSRTKDLLMTSRVVEGAEAERIGLLNRLVEFSDVRHAAIALASQVAALPPEGVRAVKQLLGLPRTRPSRESCGKHRDDDRGTPRPDDRRVLEIPGDAPRRS